MAVAVCLLPNVALAAPPVPFPSDFGSTGLWQTPTARFAGDGEFTLGVVGNSPYNRLFFSLMFLPGLEAGFRYTDITDRLYSPFADFSGKQSYKDRGFDLRLRLLKEENAVPAVALGFRDVAGTQLFGAQYLVASRSFYDFDFSAGLGWGRLGSGGPISNPFKRTVRQDDIGQGGTITLDRFFSSPKIGVFGGVTWETPIDGLQLAAEYDPNDYQNEPLGDNREVKLPINFGAKYRLPYGFLAGVSYQRGSIVSFQLSSHFNFSRREGVPKVLDPQPAPTRAKVVAAAAAKGVAPPGSDANPQVVAGEVQAALKKQRIAMEGFALSADGEQANVWVPSAPYRDALKQLGRTARAANSVLPDSVNRITVTEVTTGLETYDADLPRSALEAASGGVMTREEFTELKEIHSPAPDKPAKQVETIDYPRMGYSINPVLRSSIGGPDSFYFGQLWLKVGANADLTSKLSVTGQLGFNIYNNFDQLKLESNSQLPHVRSDIKEYLKDGQQALVRLETNYVEQLSAHWYGRLSAGIFEEMYGGVAGEVLYRPDNPRWAVGLNVNRVRQRDYDQKFTFRDYEVTTGNLTGYFELPKSVLVKLSAGQYLAGDRGGTLDVSRQFPSGIRIGAFATKTNVSAAQFGEGSFDKGFYIIIPLDFLTPRSTTGSGSFLFRLLTRDGGQMVRDGRPLYDLTSNAVRVRLPERDSLFFE